MPNWTIVTENDLKAAGHGLLVDKARGTAAGDTDPVDYELANAVARVRGACATGNQLDANPAKVPNSLKGITVNLALFALMARIGLSLSEDQRDTRKNDNSYLIRISDEKLRFETPDDAAGSGEMQTSGGIETATSTDRQRYSRDGMSGL